MRTAIPFLALIVLSSMWLSGCGGSSSHIASTDFRGTILGVVTDPSDAEEGVRTDTDIRVSWPDPDYPPPANFTFRLERDDGPYDWQGVYTEMNSSPTTRTWTFEPTSYLSEGRWYKITLTDDAGRREYVFFRTRGTPSSATAMLRAESTPTAQPKGAVEHRIETAR